LKEIPNIFLYNPTCDFAVGNGNVSWQPNQLLQKMESDMAVLPLFFATNKDIVLVQEIPAAHFIDQLKKIGVAIPAFITKETFFSDPPDKIGELHPWGWSPAAHKYFENFKDYCSNSFKQSPVFNWEKVHKTLFSKKFAHDILLELIDKFPSEEYINKNLVSEICTNKQDIEEQLKRWGSIMVKAPWSSSGRGLQPVRKKPVHPKVWEKLMGIIKTQGYALAEPYLNKAADLAFQFKLKKRKIQFVGISNFFTDSKGQYTGNQLNGLSQNTEQEIAHFINKISEQTISSLINILEQSDLAKNYEGYFGVDTLIFKDENNILKVNPCLEINTRYNMGLLSVLLEKHIYKNKKGTFKTYYNPQNDFKSFCQQMSKEYPLTIIDKKIASGFFPVTDAKKNALFGAYILV
jgi:hypothetical protein